MNHTRRQILKCLAALPVVGPIASFSASTAGAAAAPLAAVPSLLPVIPAGEVILGYKTQCGGIGSLATGLYSVFNPTGLSDKRIEQGLIDASEGRGVDWIVGRPLEIQMSTMTFSEDEVLKLNLGLVGQSPGDHVEDLWMPRLTDSV